MLLALGFPVQFVGWIMECVTSASYSISINGKLHGFFQGAKGIRQGDPLSPYLFAICLDYFSRLVKKRLPSSGYNYHPLCEKLGLSHIAYADDLILLARGDFVSVKAIFSCLDDFGKSSGLRLNPCKTKFYSTGIKECDLCDILSSIQLEVGVFPFRYLGIPLSANRLNSFDFDSLILKLKSNVEAWNPSSLSFAGRAELIRSILQGVECFWISILSLPTTVRLKADQICRSFLWGTSSAKISWTKCCLPKSEGGLGFKDLRAWNSALLTKVLWNIQGKQDSLWVRWIHQIYMKNSDVWTWQLNYRASPLIKKILLIRDELVSKLGSPELADAKLTSWRLAAKHQSLLEVYNLFRSSAPVKPSYRIIWCHNLVPKHSFVLWLAAQDRLFPLKLPDLQSGQFCLFCASHLETTQHLFFACQYTNEVWSICKQKFGIHKRLSTIASALKYCIKVNKCCSRRRDARVMKILLATTVYVLWATRNARKYENKYSHPCQIATQIERLIFKQLYLYYPDLLSWLEP